MERFKYHLALGQLSFFSILFHFIGVSFHLVLYRLQADIFTNHHQDHRVKAAGASIPYTLFRANGHSWLHSTDQPNCLRRFQGIISNVLHTNKDLLPARRHECRTTVILSPSINSWPPNNTSSSSINAQPPLFGSQLDPEGAPRLQFRFLDPLRICRNRRSLAFNVSSSLNSSGSSKSCSSGSGSGCPQAITVRPRRRDLFNAASR